MTRVGRKGLILGPVTIKDGPSGPVNTVAPAIPASAVIGTQLVTTPGTWTGATTLTYQWQRNTGSWVDIGGATSANYTPVDADFGRALRVVETADGAVSANSNDTGLTAEAPVQSLGAELMVDGNMEAVGTAAYSATAATLSKTATSAYEGSQSLRVTSTATGAFIAQQVVMTIGNYYEMRAAVRSGGVATPSLATAGAFLWTGTTSTSWQEAVAVFRADSIQMRLNSTSPAAGNTADIDAWTVKQITPNTQLTSPSANMKITQYYTLPGSPVKGAELWVMPRISDFAAGNYWLVHLRWTGSQWDINLYSVASHARTSRIAATNIGATNGIRVTANGDDWTLETTANGGTNWTSRGTVNNNTYNTATGVNVLYASSITPGTLAYAVP